MGLLITKETGNFFSLKLNDETPIISEQNRLTTVGNFCHFKTVSGANIIKDQNILYSDITLVASGTFTFASINALWVKLIEVGFFDGLGTGGGGTGVDQFTELLDTFNSYIGRDGQALVVNESELKIETVPFANVSAFTGLSDTPNPLLPNKMIITNADGTALIMTDLPTTPETYLNAVGSFHYADLATQTTPLTIVANVPKKLMNDAQGAYTIISNAPYGVSSVWNTVTNQLDFSEMNVGDMLTLRIDANVTTSSANQTLKCYVKMGIGSASEFDLILAQAQVKSAGTYPFVAEVSLDLAYQDVVDYPAEFYIVSDGGGSIKINGWYVEILRKNINIVDIVTDLGYTPENIANKQNSLTADGTGVKYPTVDAVRSEALLLEGTQVGNPITGDVEIYNEGDDVSISIKYNTLFGDFIFGDENNFISKNSIYGKDLTYESYFSLNSQDNLLISSTNPNYKGITGAGNFSPNITDLDYPQKIYVDSGLASKADKQGTILYHSVKWFTPSSTVSNVGATVTSVGTQFTSGMVGSILRINDEDRLILSYTSSTVVVVDVAYSTNYSAVVAGSWGVYSRSLAVANTGTVINYSYQGVTMFTYLASDQFNVRFSGFSMTDNSTAVQSTGLLLKDTGRILWSNDGTYYGTKDTGLRRNAAGILEIYDGVTATGLLANRRDLMVRKLLVNKSTDNGVDSLQVDGTISMSPATLSNQGVVKSQLDAVTSTVLGTDISLSSGQSPYTLLLTDANNRLTTNGTFNQNYSIVVPTNASVAFPIGTKIRINCSASEVGTVTLSGSGITFLGANLKIRYGSSFNIIKVATDTWYVEQSNILQVNSSNRIVTTGDSGFSGIFEGYFDGSLLNSKFPVYTVATLPTTYPNASVGNRAYVTDALTPTYLGVAVGGGSVICPVFFNGTNWIT